MKVCTTFFPRTEKLRITQIINHSAMNPEILLVLFSCFKVLFTAEVEQRSNSQFERVITDYNDVLRGVPIDFSYNESISGLVSRNGLSSVPGCPKSEEGIPWVYYGSPPKCYLANEKGPCGADQKLFIKAGSPFGICNCECFQDGYIPSFNFNKLQFCQIVNRDYVFDPKSLKCFATYDQGPCNKNEWLVKIAGKEDNVRCEERKCPTGQVPWGGKDSNDKSFNATADCFSPIAVYSSPTFITPNSCGEGAKYSDLLKKCIKKSRSSVIGR